jgi:hypothetical protein
LHSRRIYHPNPEGGWKYEKLPDRLTGGRVSWQLGAAEKRFTKGVKLHKKFKRFWLALVVLGIVLAMASCSGTQTVKTNKTDLIAFSSETSVESLRSDRLQVGVHRIDISPAYPVILGGYGTCFGSIESCRWATGVHDPLFASAIAITKGDDALVILSLDSLGLAAQDADPVRQAVAQRLSISVDRVILTSSHSHAAPDTVGLWGTIFPAESGRDEQYMRFVKVRSVEAAIRAWENRVPAAFDFAVTQEADLHFNTYIETVPEPPIDHTLTVLRAVGDNGGTIATIMNWGCHPTTEQAENRLISSDWVGPYREAMAEQHGGMHIFVNGSIGAAIQPSVPWRDKNLGGEGQGFVWAEAMGKALSETTSKALTSAKPLPVDSIQTWSRNIEVRQLNRPFQLARTLGLLAMDMPPYGGSYQTKITAVKIGDFRIGTMPGEVSPQIGTRVRKELGGQAQMIVGLGQDYLGYIIDVAQYEDPIFAYEKLLCIDPNLGDYMVEAYRSLGLSESAPQLLQTR